MDYTHSRYINRKLKYGSEYYNINFTHPSVLGIYNTSSKGYGRYIVGSNPTIDGNFKKAQPNDIAEYDYSIESWVFSKPYKGQEVINIDQNDTDYGLKLLQFDGTKWLPIMDMQGGGGGGSFDYAKVAGRLESKHKFFIRGAATAKPIEFDGTQDIGLNVENIDVSTDGHTITGILPIYNGGTGNNYGGATCLSRQKGREQLLLQLTNGASGYVMSDLSPAKRNLVLEVQHLNANRMDQGTLEVTHGGTGKNSFVKNKILVGNDSEHIKEMDYTVGKSNKPIWISDGNIYECEKKLDNDIWGNADTATRLKKSAGNTSIPVFFFDGQPEQCTSISLPVHATADIAKKLEISRNISLIGDVSGNAWFDGTKDISINTQIINSYEAYLQWGAGANNISRIKSEMSPVDIAANPRLGTNIFRRMTDQDLNGIKIEYSANGGTNWQTYKNDIITKYNLTNLKTELELRGPNTNRRSSNTDRLRITINSQGEDSNWTSIRCILKKLHLYIESNGSKNITCQIRIKVEDISSSEVGKISWNNARWQNVGTFKIDGWPAWNAIDFTLKDTLRNTLLEFGGSYRPMQLGQIRPVATKLELTFKQDGIEEWSEGMAYSREEVQSSWTGLKVCSLYGYGPEDESERNPDASPIAYQLQNARNFQISGKAIAAAKSFNGTQDINLNVTDVSANRLDHNVKFSLNGDIKGEITTNLNSNEVNITTSYSNTIGLVPTGTIITFYGKSAPNGYLVCDGSWFDANSYPNLYRHLGTNKLPDLRNKFLQGYGSYGVGTTVQPGLPNITGNFSAVFEDHEIFQPTGAFFWEGYARECPSVAYRDQRGYGFNASRCSSLYGSSNTVQPYSFVILPCIKY